ncbi:MAG: MOSC domain-containing protein [Deltaproteobacteria bacterium]|nr:MOSC domain-containing protein [Deltaproteobacteria bacterium]
MAQIIAVCTSEQKGTNKKTVSTAVARENFGLVGDAHADCHTHRQVSLLAVESIHKMRNHGLEVGPGDFAENLTTRNIDLASLPIGTRLEVGDDIILELTQIGKKCHTKCAIFHQVGTCIMPKEGVFARVIRGGIINAGDTIRIKDVG